MAKEQQVTVKVVERSSHEKCKRQEEENAGSEAIEASQSRSQLLIPGPTTVRSNVHIKIHKSQDTVSSHVIGSQRVEQVLILDFHKWEAGSATT